MFTLTPAEQTMSAGFCVRASSVAGWRTLLFAGGVDTVPVAGQPRFQLVNADFAQLGTKLILSLQLPKAGATTKAYITSQGHCKIPPTLTNSSDAATSGLFVGAGTAAAGGFVTSAEGALTLDIPSARLPTVPAGEVMLCITLDKVADFAPVNRDVWWIHNTRRTASA